MPGVLRRVCPFSSLQDLEGAVPARSEPGTLDQRPGSRPARTGWLATPFRQLWELLGGGPGRAATVLRRGVWGPAADLDLRHSRIATPSDGTPRTRAGADSPGSVQSDCYRSTDRCDVPRSQRQGRRAQPDQPDPSPQGAVRAWRREAPAASRSAPDRQPARSRRAAVRGRGAKTAEARC